MNRNCADLTNGYIETIQRGIDGVRNFSDGISRGMGKRQDQLLHLKREIESADAIVIGAGAGLSTAAGFTYSGERFEKYFFDFAEEFGIQDMYSGGFYPFPDAETRWAWWARHIYFNRYIDAPKPLYRELLRLVEGKDSSKKRIISWLPLMLTISSNGQGSIRIASFIPRGIMVYFRV